MTSNGPRVDFNADPMDSHGTGPSAARPTPPMPPAATPAKPSALVGIALITAMIALGMSVWALAVPPEPILGSAPSPSFPVDGSSDRVAKLEADMQKVMLHLVTLSDQVKSLQEASGGMDKIGSLAARVSALEALAQKGLQPEAAAPAAADPPKPQAAEEKPKPAKAEPRKQVYKVRPGDSLYKIAKRFKVEIADLRRWNGMSRGSVLKAGEKLVIYK